MGFELQPVENEGVARRIELRVRTKVQQALNSIVAAVGQPGNLRGHKPSAAGVSRCQYPRVAYAARAA
jgi:hypothetical protein